MITQSYFLTEVIATTDHCNTDIWLLWRHERIRTYRKHTQTWRAQPFTTKKTQATEIGPYAHPGNDVVCSSLMVASSSGMAVGTSMSYMVVLQHSDVTYVKLLRAASIASRRTFCGRGTATPNDKHRTSC